MEALVKPRPMVESMLTANLHWLGGLVLVFVLEG